MLPDGGTVGEAIKSNAEEEEEEEEGGGAEGSGDDKKSKGFAEEEEEETEEEETCCGIETGAQFAKRNCSGSTGAAAAVAAE